MSRQTALTAAVCSWLLLGSLRVATGQDPRSLQLGAPNLAGGKPLFECLQERKSTREFAPDRLSIEILSNLFWAAFGVNRPDTDGRTAPSALGMHEIDLYAALPEGVFKYDSRSHQLVFVHKEDVRPLTGDQPFVKDAPLNIVYVADYSRMSKSPLDQRDFYAATDTGFISQNVYLYCASEGLATVVRAGIDRGALAKALRLRSDQRITLAQSVGYVRK
jgi:SagB-type dehydrogenase family enzyme